MGLADARRPEEEHVGGVGDEGHRGQLADLALVDRWLKAKVELGEGPLEGEMRQARAGSEVALAAGGSLRAEEIGEQLGVGGLALGRGVESALEDGGGLGEAELLEVPAGLLERDHRTASSPTV